MPVGNGAAEIGLEFELVRAHLARLFATFDSVYNDILKRTKTDEVSYRATKIPFQVSGGIKARGGNLLDGGDLGRGGAPLIVDGSVAITELDWIAEYTAHARIATDSGKKAIKKYAQLVVTEHMFAAQHDLGALFCYGDSANTVGVVTPNPNITGSPFYDSGNLIFYVDRAARFRVGADYDYYNSGPGTTITGTFTCAGVDPGRNAVYVSATPTTAPASGATIAINNSVATIGSGFNGVLALNQTLTTGTFMNVTKSAYPGAFNNSAINAGGGTLTPQLARLLLNTLLLNAGVDVSSDAVSDYQFTGDLGQKAAWENTGIAATQVIQPGNAVGHDMLPATQITTIGGIKFRALPTYLPGRIDLWDMKTLFAVETQPLDYYSVGDVEQFWPSGASGGVASSIIKYLVWAGNIGCDNPKRNGVIYGLANTSGY